MTRIVVTHKTFDDALAHIASQKFLGLDVETTGLKPYLGHKLFSMQISSSENDYYFNFDATPDHLGNYAPAETILARSWFDLFKPIFDDENKVWFSHNAKFELHFISKEGREIAGRVLCIKTMARLINNQLPFAYTLENIGSLVGFEKDETVKKYITKHKLFTDVDVGKKRPRRDKHYDLVPFSIMSEYGLTDGNLHYHVGMYCYNRLLEMAKEQSEAGLPDLMHVWRNEEALTKVLYKMEKVGCKFDRDYCKEAYEWEVEQRDEVADKFYAYTGIEFQDSPTCFKAVFEKLGLKPAYTDKGNPSFAEDVLPDNPVTELILAWRGHNKKAGTYWRNYIDLMDHEDVIHCNFKQDGTVTGRMSSSDPNLQNVPKRGEDKSKYPVRRGIIPREGYFLAMLDFDQMEYRLLLDVAEEMGVIDKIKNEGLDVHTATANTMGVERDPAKTLNFMLLYGGGAQKLADTLRITLQKAKQYKSIYFRSLGAVKRIVNSLQQVAKTRGYLVNWAGRRIQLDVAYRMPNHYIQGGCGDVCKEAMINIDNFLTKHNFNSRMLLQVHDELIFEIKYGEELKVLPELKGIMENTYPHKHIKLTAGIDYSKTDWHNKGGWNGESVSIT